MFLKRFALPASGILAVLLVFGCGGKSKSTTTPTPVPIRITATPLPPAAVGTAYSATLAGTGGIGPYSWSLASGSTLPAGLTLSTAGAISGIPMASGVGTANVTFQMTDSGSATAPSTTSAFALTVKAAPAITFPSSTLAAGKLNVAYSGAVAGTGGAGTLTHTLAAGQMPSGLTLAATGAITGTPTAAGTSLITVKAADAFGDSAQQLFSLNISYPAVIITTATVPAGNVGAIYPQTVLLASGGAGYGYKWSVTTGSTLPAGLVLSSSGILSGKPTTTGATSVGVTVADVMSNTAAATLSFEIEDAFISISTTRHLAAYLGAAYSGTLTATGGSGTGYTWALASGSTLPAGFSFSKSGTLSGNPTSTLITSIIATVTDSASHTASATFSLTVEAGVSITTLRSLPAAIVGGNYYTTLGAIGGSSTGYTWAVSAGSTLPAGLTLSTSGTLRGTPASTGHNSFSFTVTDSASNTAAAVFSLDITAAITVTTPGSLPSGYVGANYAQTLSATGGTGTGYTWSVTAGASSLAAVNLSVLPGGLISGKPLAAGTAAFTVQVTDSFADTASGSFSLVINIPTAPTLPAANPASLPSATVDQAYAGTVDAAGGVPPFTWTVNGAILPADGISTMLLGNGLSVRNNGSNVLSVTGTPNPVGPVSFTAQIADSLSAVSAMAEYTLDVNNPGMKVSGKIGFTNNCGATVPPITVSISTSPVQTTTTDGSGNYSFASVPSGTFTITPSISGPSSVFYPNILTSVVGSTTPVTGQDFAVNLGYDVAGSVVYAGSQTGQIYVTLSSISCGGAPLGTSISVLGDFTIKGVPPGTYTLSAGRDPLGYGYTNANSPSGSTNNVTVSNTSLTGQSVSITDPSAPVLAAGPTLQAISPTDQGVVVNFGAITANINNTTVEVPTSYVIEWSTDSSFTSQGAGSMTLPATGANESGVWILNNFTTGIYGTFVNGTPYYFRAQGMVGTTAGPWTVYGGSSTATPVTVNAPTGGNTVSGRVTFTHTTPGPLYVGFFEQSTGLVYSTRIEFPVSPQDYTVQVPNGDYFFFGILDQNNNGMVDPGDMSNTRDDSSAAISITASTSSQDLTLPSTKSSAVVTTNHWTNTNSGVTTSGYGLNLNLRAGTKLPVAVQLLSGPNVIKPVDLGKCTDCAKVEFQGSFSTASVSPAMNDAYSFSVTYSDGTTETVSGLVTAVMDDFATNLAPATGSTTPTLTWNYPPTPASYVYQFRLGDNNGNSIWQIPGNNAKINGFSNTVPQIVWGTDPTGDTNNTPSGILTTGSNYTWQIQVQDSNGNSTQTQVDYKP